MSALSPDWCRHPPLPSQLVREFMRDFVKRQRDGREHDAWFRAEVEAGFREADDPRVKRIPSEDVVTGWRRQRADLVARAGEPTE